MFITPRPVLKKQAPHCVGPLVVAGGRLRLGAADQSNNHEVLLGVGLSNDYNVKVEILYSRYKVKHSLEMDQIEKTALVAAIKNEISLALRCH
jgi:hypothetical protein